jgi:hypothetical protein
VPYPRELSDFENRALQMLLPLDRDGYKPYYEFLTRAQVIGEGRWGIGDLILAEAPSEIDLTAGMNPVVAYGELTLRQSATLTVSIHTPEDRQMEVQFGGDTAAYKPEDILSSWTYSSWKPGDADPGSGATLRTIQFQDKNAKVLYVLAISTFHRSIWVHHVLSSFNQLLPVTGFYEYLIRAKAAEAGRESFRPSGLFQQLNDFTDEELRMGLLHYNDENRKFDATAVAREPIVKQGALAQLVGKLFGKHG